MVQLAAGIAVVILVGLGVLQALLIAGRPLGRYAWGAQHTVLPAKLRIASGVAVVLYAVFCLLVLHQAGSIHVFERASWLRPLFAGVTAYFFIGTFMNALSRSRSEKWVMTPVAATLALLFLYVFLRTQ